MNIVLCIPCLLTGGTEIQTLSLVQSLTQNGHHITTICYYEFSEQMVTEFQKAGSRVICLSPNGKRQYGIKSVIFLYKKLRKIIKSNSFDLAHVQYMAPGATPIILLRWLGVKNILATIHTCADIYSGLKLVRFLQRRLVKAFICISKTAEASFFLSGELYTLDTKLKPHNHFTIYNSLPQNIDIRTEPRDFSLPLTLGVVSRLEKIKGMDLVIPAYQIIKSEYPLTKLIIVGDGSLKDDMMAQDNDPTIQWVGRQELGEVQKYLDQIDILLMPSRSEGFGLSAIEAMARGCVVVASDVGALHEVVKPNVGLLHKSEDSEDMAQKIKQLISNPKIMESLSEESMKHVKNYNFSNYKTLINNLYDKCLS